MAKSKAKDYPQDQEEDDLFDRELKILVDVELKSLKISVAHAARTIGYAPGTLRTTKSKAKKIARTAKEKNSSKYIVPVLKEFIEEEKQRREYYRKLKKGEDVSNIRLSGTARVAGDSPTKYNEPRDKDNETLAHLRAFRDFMLDEVYKGDENAKKEARSRIEDKAREYLSQATKHSSAKNTTIYSKGQKKKSGKNNQDPSSSNEGTTPNTEA